MKRGVILENDAVIHILYLRVKNLLLCYYQTSESVTFEPDLMDTDPSKV